jgi:hypothetical protein
MLYAVGIFTYFIGSVASVLVALDAKQAPKKEQAASSSATARSRRCARSSRRPMGLESRALGREFPGGAYRRDPAALC